MIKRFAFFASALLMMSTAPLMAATDAQMAELEAKKAAADRVLNDDSFFKKWSPKGAIQSPDEAEKVKEGADVIRDRLDRALIDSQAWCKTRFFVNSCYKDARDLHLQRERELRQITVTAEDVLRADRTRRISEKLAKQRAEKAEPVKLGKPGEKVHASPLNVGRRTAEGEGMPADHVGQTAEDVRQNHEQARLAREQEEANIAAFEKKQQEAAARLAQSQAKAAERRASREAHRESFQKKMEERTEAQERYERKQQVKESGLKKFF